MTFETDSKGVLAPSEAVDIVDKCLAAVEADPDHVEAVQVAKVTGDCLDGVREGLATMAVRQ